MDNISLRRRFYAKESKMKKSILFMVVGCLVFGGCYTPPPVRPAMSQTVITIQRYPSRTDAKKSMEIYIDDTKNSISVGNGQSVSVPVNDGVHYIFVKVGKNQSETLNFTAAQSTVSFLASVEGGAFKKTKVVLSRSTVVDDTGSMTDKKTQEQFIPK
jgi:hypothetical protein